MITVVLILNCTLLTKFGGTFSFLYLTGQTNSMEKGGKQNIIEVQNYIKLTKNCRHLDLKRPRKSSLRTGTEPLDRNLAARV